MFKRLIIPCLLLIAGTCTAQKPLEINLNFNWTFQKSGDVDWMKATVPGTVHTDLMDNNKIPDPYYRNNEKLVQWVDKVSWVYRTSFDVPARLVGMENLELDFKGLDTYADVYLNGKLLFSADNFFVGWKADLKRLIKLKGNVLKVVFYSPISKGMEGLRKLGYGLPSPNDQSEVGGIGDHKVGVFLRKPGYHFGWDWGPRLVTSGIWLPVYLRGWNAARITDVFYEQKKVAKEKAALIAHVKVQAARAADLRLEVSNDDKQIIGFNVKVKEGDNSIDLPFDVLNPRLWWPHNLGEPHVYDFKVSLLNQQKVLDEKRKKVGLRDVKIIQKPDSAGSSFYVQINGIPVFCKGANYIPQDMFIPRVTDGEYDSLIRAAKSANINMLRVWGGGFYEKDVFYDLCDKNGIMVWQDFMFACSMFPGDSSYLDKIQNEATYNITRLRNHSSIVLWCGNNEIDVAWGNYQEKAGWGWKQKYTDLQQAELWLSYQKIFNQILPQTLRNELPSAFYWSSSPFNTKYVHASDDTKYGDMHYWGVWHGEHDFEAFADHIGRFVSEYGFQSFPEFETVKKFTLPEDWRIDSEIMNGHQRTPIGNLRIKSYMEKYYNMPSDFRNQLYLGQVLQAEGMKMGMEVHRRAMPYNMGSIYWQINDCWPVASWSGMDYYQNWKGLHYFVKKAFQNVLVSPFVKDDHLKVQIVSDSLVVLDGVLELIVKDFGGKVIFTEIHNCSVKPNSSSTVVSLPVTSLLKGVSKADVFLSARLRLGGKIIAENVMYFDRIKNVNLPKVNVSSEINRTEYGAVVVLRSPLLAKNVCMKFEDTEGHFSDNYFDLLPGESKVVTFRSRKKLMATRKLQILTVRDTY